ncbi:Thiol:disulfide interchange protein DsbD [Gammaproteobacteria bacterium]
MNKTFLRPLWVVVLLLSAISSATGAEVPVSEPHNGPLATLVDLTRRLHGNDEPLTPEVAFPFLAEVTDAATLTASWNIVPGHYLYRDKMRFRLIDAPAGVSLGTIDLPHGDPKKDEDLGLVEVYHNPVQVRLPIQRPPGDALALTLEAKFQGCAEDRLCYPPQTRSVNLTLPPTGTPGSATASPLLPTANTTHTDSEQDRIAAFLAGGNRALVLAWFFGIGLLLAFTPCVFPMIPILSSIIVGQGKGLTTARAFLLSLVYVLAMAATYTIAGVVAGLVGTNLQALFQDPWIIITFSIIFVALALSMFGLYELQLPTQLQSHLTVLSNHQEGGTLVGVAVMGFLSALIVGPCVAPPLAGALIYISRSGDAILGGLALFSMSMGMGTPLLVIGTTEGRWLPRAGVWMNAVKAIFGVLLLVVALEMLERILPTAVTLILWATLYIVCGVYLGALDHLPTGISGWQRLWKGIGLVLLVQGILVLTGAASGSDDPFQPLKALQLHRAITPTHLTAIGTTDGAPNAPTFRRVADSMALDRALATAEGRPILLDFYADWCVECKRMERTTFTDPAVRAALADVILLQADVTKNTAADQALLRRFELFGPPALLFFGPDGTERRDARLIGFIDAGQFRAHLEQGTLHCRSWTC